MEKITKQTDTYILRFDKGEELLTLLSSFCTKEKIQAAYFSAIGAASEVTVSFYNLKTKKYQDKIYKEDVEIVSILGNISYVEDQVRIHAHGSFSREDYSMFGGHIQNLIVSATCEVHLTLLKNTMSREFDEETGLFLLKEN